MRRTGWLVCVGLICALAGCGRAPTVEYQPTATIKDIMDSIVDPSADALWGSVATVVNLQGTFERAPKTPEEWLAVRRSAVQLVEATNLLLIRGRHVARPGERSENPDVELGPEEIETLINADRRSWEQLAGGLHDAAALAFKAADVKDKQALFDAGEHIDNACETCHQKYWYPPKPVGAAK